MKPELEVLFDQLKGAVRDSCEVIFIVAERTKLTPEYPLDRLKQEVIIEAMKRREDEDFLSCLHSLLGFVQQRRSRTARSKALDAVKHIQPEVGKNDAS